MVENSTIEKFIVRGKGGAVCQAKNAVLAGHVNNDGDKYQPVLFAKSSRCTKFLSVVML